MSRCLCHSVILLEFAYLQARVLSPPCSDSIFFLWSEGLFLLINVGRQVLRVVDVAGISLLLLLESLSSIKGRGLARVVDRMASCTTSSWMMEVASFHSNILWVCIPGAGFLKDPLMRARSASCWCLSLERILVAFFLVSSNTKSGLGLVTGWLGPGQCIPALSSPSLSHTAYQIHTL